MSDSLNLKPCPFCGEDGAFHHSMSGNHYIACGNPGCVMRTGTYETWASLDEAATAWNTRTHKPAPAPGDVADIIAKVAEHDSDGLLDVKEFVGDAFARKDKAERHALEPSDSTQLRPAQLGDARNTDSPTPVEPSEISYNKQRLIKIAQFIHDRMINVHGENENVDYLHGLRDVIKYLHTPEPVSVSLEAGARAICKDMGIEPDATNGEGDPTEPGLWRSWPQWQELESSAKACAEAWGLPYVD